jgi:hypothetical protein
VRCGGFGSFRLDGKDARAAVVYLHTDLGDVGRITTRACPPPYWIALVVIFVRGHTQLGASVVIQTS